MSHIVERIDHSHNRYPQYDFKLEDFAHLAEEEVPIEEIFVPQWDNLTGESFEHLKGIWYNAGDMQLLCDLNPELDLPCAEAFLPNDEIIIDYIL